MEGEKDGDKTVAEIVVVRGDKKNTKENEEPTRLEEEERENLNEPKCERQMIKRRKYTSKKEVQCEEEEEEEEDQNLTVILFYKYVDLRNAVEMIAEQQKRICRKLELTGRLRIAPEGINGTLCGHPADIDAYQEFMEATKQFEDIQYKISHAKFEPFNDSLLVRMCNEITATGPMGNCRPKALGGSGGKHVRPEEFHELVKQAEQDPNVVLIDTRNWYETNLGTFRGAIDPKIRNFAQFPSWLDSNKDLITNKHVAMFCTGGIRCEKASAYVKSLGLAKQVSQLEGGIHSYLEQFSSHAVSHGVRTAKGGKSSQVIGKNEECLYEGVNFQFDERLGADYVGRGNISSHGLCTYCKASYSIVKKNVVCSVCKEFLLVCDSCIAEYQTPKCLEHQLLDIDWKVNLGPRISSKEAVRLVAALQRLLETSKSKPNQRAQRKRQKTLTLEIDRLKELVRERGDMNLLINVENIKTVPFVPLFSAVLS